MRNVKMNYLLIALSVSALGAFATSGKTTNVTLCATEPTPSGPGINAECPYTPSVICCYIAPGNSSQYVKQLQDGSNVTIRRHPDSPTAIFGIRSDF